MARQILHLPVNGTISNSFVGLLLEPTSRTIIMIMQSAIDKVVASMLLKPNPCRIKHLMVGIMLNAVADRFHVPVLGRTSQLFFTLAGPTAIG